MDADTRARVERATGSRPTAWTAATGGYSIAPRWSVDLADGRKVFCKLANTGDIARRLRQEHANMTALPATFRCEVLAWEDADEPLLVVEDLSHGRWPPPWDPADLRRVMATLESMWSTPAPIHLPDAVAYREALSGWARVAAEPEPFLSLGLCTRSWFEGAIGHLVEAERRLVLDGDDLIHLDVRSDNLCLLEDRVVLVDWNFASRGPRALDLAYWLPSLRLEGGPLPDEFAPGLACEAAAVSGMFAAHAGLPPPDAAPTVRRFQLRQLRIALPWVCRELGIEPPDVAWARPLGAALGADLRAGRITESEWFERGEEVLIDAYLASADPRAQSGKSGGEDDWRWSRELVLDAVVGRECHLLDVGCANGYLMESLHRWGSQRGLVIEPYGLEISERMAFQARLRLPRWADRIWAGNSLDWTPPRRFDLVHTALDYAPHARRRELVERTLRDLVVPGGRVVFRAERVGERDRDVASQLRDLGIEPDGVLESMHPAGGAVRGTAWLQRP